MEAAAKKRPAQALPLARDVLGLCPADHADAARAKAVIAQATAAGEQGYAALGDAAKPKALHAFMIEWTGTAPGTQAQARYDALAAAAVKTPEHPAAGAANADLTKWIAAVGRIGKEWPDSALARELETDVGKTLDETLDGILAEDAGPKRHNHLVAFAKAFQEQPAGKRALGVLQAEQAAAAPKKP